MNKSMFKKKIDPRMIDTVIGEGTIFEGNLKSEASIRIEGHVTGAVEGTGSVMIGEKGVVKSNISACDVMISGTVHGNVKATGTLTVAATGKLHGDTNAHSLVIDEGGRFLGTSKMELLQKDQAIQQENNSNKRSGDESSFINKQSV
jgi:cytoskeletal protein CcmA (bactofilin family)